MKAAELKLLRHLDKLDISFSYFYKNMIGLENHIKGTNDVNTLSYLLSRYNKEELLILFEKLTPNQVYWLENNFGKKQIYFNALEVCPDMMNIGTYTFKRLVNIGLVGSKYLINTDSYIDKYNTSKRLINDRDESFKKSIIASNLAKFQIAESFKNSDSRFYNLVTNYIKYANFDKCNYFSVRESKISYHPKPDKQQIVPNLGTWKKEGRQLTTFTKAVKLIFGKYADIILKLETRKGLSIENESLKLQISPLKAVQVSFEKAYTQSMYNWSQSSCMTDKGYFEIYQKNPNVFTAYLFKENNEVVGRAYTVKSSNGTFLDRIYFKNEKHLKSIQKLAVKKGWYYKRYNNYDSTQFTNGTACITPNDIEIVEMDINDYFPFIDTFCYMNSDCTELSVSPDNMSYRLQNTGGEYEEIEDQHEGEVQLENGDWIDEDDAICVEIGSCEGEWYERDECCHIDSGRETGWCHESDCTYNENLGEYILN